MPLEAAFAGEAVRLMLHLMGTRALEGLEAVFASRAIRRTATLEALLGMPVLPMPRRGAVPREGAAVLAWGRKPSARRAERWAARHGLPVVYVEDGFLRSLGPGRCFPPLSLLVDREGVHYDATAPSGLERLIGSDTDLLGGVEGLVREALDLVRRDGLGKYNHAPDLLEERLDRTGRPRVLVVDQTAGDLSIRYGRASAHTFRAMLEAARRENPDAVIYVKTHPEAAAGAKRAHLVGLSGTDRLVLLREPLHGPSLVRKMDRVYVVSSQLGFEALVAGKPVTCFGLPWYAGWGLTDDRQGCERRGRRRSLEELFAAAFVHAACWLDPETGLGGTVLDAARWLARQRRVLRAMPRRWIAVGFPGWRAANLGPILSPVPGRVHFVRSAREAERLAPGPGDALLQWGAREPEGVAALAEASGARHVRMEDGFVRSVGLGSDLLPPRSVVLDGRGIYFDAGRESDLEHLLNTHRFTPEELARARRVREFICRYRITKYNLEPLDEPDWATEGRKVVLVPGQVEDDASIRHGCVEVRTNLALVEAARAEHPDAFLVYKPHPDVVAGNRRGGAMRRIRALVDHVETEVSLVRCVEACDVVHTMTSLSGFDALLRGKRVVVYGRPFYAGWGLTDDRVAVPRRQRRLSLDELVAGALLLYPLYWDPVLRGYASCEAVLRALVAERARLQASLCLERLWRGRIRRIGRRLGAVIRGVWVQVLRAEGRC